MFRPAILVILGTSITAFVSFFVVVSYGLFPRGEYTHRVSVSWARLLLWITCVKVEVVGQQNVLMGRPPKKAPTLISLSLERRAVS